MASPVENDAEHYAAHFNEFIAKYAEENPKSFYGKQINQTKLMIGLGASVFDYEAGSPSSILYGAYLYLSRWIGYHPIEDRIVPKIVSVFRGPALKLEQPADGASLRAASGFVPMNLPLSNEKALEFCNELPSEAVFAK